MSFDEFKERVEMLSDFEAVKDHLFIRLSPINEEVVKNSPHYIVEDLMMTYHIFVPDEEDGFFSARITNNMLKSYGISSGNLREAAIKSTSYVMGPKILGLAEAVGTEDETGNTALVVTNELGIFGASVLFYPGMMNEIAIKVSGSFYALPSSQHEFIIIPETLASDVDELSRMVETANQTVVAAQDYLSDSVYRYDYITHRFGASDTNKARIATSA